MSFLSKISLKDLKEKCKLLNIKDYGKKDQIVARIKKHYIDNDLGIFNLEEYLNTIRTPSEETPSEETPSEEAPSEETPSEEIPLDILPAFDEQEAISPSSSIAYTQPASVNNVLIEEEDEEQDDQEEVVTKKRKISVHPIYIVDTICTN